MIGTRVQSGLLVMAIAFFTVTSLFYFPFTADDAFIVARYAVNARDLGEWSFNPGERVTAMTSPLHGLVLVALSFAADDPLPPYKVAAIILVVAAFAFLIAGFGVTRREAAPLAAVIVAPSFILWMFAGLETPLLAAIVAALTAAFVRTNPGDQVRLLVLALLAGLAVLARYDAVLFACPILLSAIVQPGHSWRSRTLAVVVAGAAPAAWFIYSWLQFGAILPTSFYIKTPTGALEVLGANARYMAQHLAITGLITMAVYVAVRVAAGGDIQRLLRDELRARWGLHLGLFAVLLYGTTMATVHMMFAFRHFMPYVAPAALTLALLARRADERTPNARISSSRFVEAAVVMLILTVHVFQGNALYRRSLQGLGTEGEYAAEGMTGYERDFIPAMRRNADDVRSHWATLNMGRPPRIWTFAAGALPYELRSAYIYEELVSFRHHCPPRAEGDRPDSRHWRPHADYIHAFTRHGALGRLLSPVRSRQVQLISQHRIFFNGRDEELLVYYNPAPRPNILPARIDQPCIAPPAVGG
jgi:hypothetical protein